MIRNEADHFETRSQFSLRDKTYDYYSLRKLADAGMSGIERLPMCLKVLLENLLRHQGTPSVQPKDIESLASWDGKSGGGTEIAFVPARVLLQDFTGVPGVVDLASMRAAVKRMGGDPQVINPLRPADLVIDHSVQVDAYGSADALEENTRIEMERNRERYFFLKWGQQAFDRFRAVPPGNGIVHQINLEYLAYGVFVEQVNGSQLAYPDTLVGTDSHTTMINGLGVVGWGVGGIEAEAALLGQPIPLLIPDVVGFRLDGEMPVGATATDLVLTATQMLRARGVVGKFVEFFGPGLSSLGLADRATLANMAPEYGATIGFFPIDRTTIEYLRFTGRDADQVDLVEAYCKEQGLYRTEDSPDPIYTDTLKLDLGTVEPCIAGPKRPQDRIKLSESKPAWRKTLAEILGPGDPPLSQKLVDAWISGSDDEKDLDDLTKTVSVGSARGDYELEQGSVVIAAITSCTNTSNPSVMMAAGLLARNAIEKGLNVKPWVKTSLAPGSKVVTEYLRHAGLMGSLEALNFHLVGYGCTTCIGNSGPLPADVSKAVADEEMVVAAVLSGNRNFEARINAQVKANYLASPPLVVAYALAGKMDIDFDKEPIGTGKGGQPVYLKDIWPTSEEVARTVAEGVKSEMFNSQYANVFDGDDDWKALKAPEGDLYAWDDSSTYIKEPPFFDGMEAEPSDLQDITNARVLAMLGDSVTTDHISPAGSIKADSPAGLWLQEQGVEPKNFNSYGSRRGNHEVMIRGTFGNVRLRNLLAPGTEGGVTTKLPDGVQMPIYDAAAQYRREGVSLVVLAGKEYGTGSSRDWAAKGTSLLGVRAVIAESFERIHRSNLIGMGVLPLEYAGDKGREGLGLTGQEIFSIAGIATGLEPGKELVVKAATEDGKEKQFRVKARIDTPVELEYYRHGGILQYVLRSLMKK